MTLQRLSHKLGLFAVLGLVLGFAACNTIEGAGKDVSATGRAVSNTAEETKQTY
jgi:predicted small secreted protein